MQLENASKLFLEYWLAMKRAGIVRGDLCFSTMEALTGKWEPTESIWWNENWLRWLEFEWGSENFDSRCLQKVALMPISSPSAGDSSCCRDVSWALTALVVASTCIFKFLDDALLWGVFFFFFGLEDGVIQKPVCMDYLGTVQGRGRHPDSISDHPANAQRWGNVEFG